MQWQARVRQMFKRKEIEMALHEFTIHQQQQKKIDGKDQDRKSKRAKAKLKNEHDGSGGISDGGSDEENDS